MLCHPRCQSQSCSFSFPQTPFSCCPLLSLAGAKATDVWADYPLPPNEETTEILRVVVRESMSLDLLDRLISDIIAVTQTLMECDIGDLTALQPTATSTEKQHQSLGVDAKHRNKHGSKRPMREGVHRTVC